MKKFVTIKYVEDGHVARVILNRPEKLNAINATMIRELNQVIDEIRDNPDIHLLEVSGEGRAFSAGVDLKETTADKFGTDSEIIKEGFELIRKLETLKQVTIAKIHGFCFTGALELALIFDLMYCADNTQFGDTHAKWAILPRWGMTQRLARRVGLSKAKELTFRAMRFSGREAERMGMANAAFPAEKLDRAVGDIEQEILLNNQEAIQRIKYLYDEGYSGTLKDGLMLEQESDPQLNNTEEMLSQFETKKKEE